MLALTGIMKRTTLEATEKGNIHLHKIQPWACMQRNVINNECICYECPDHIYMIVLAHECAIFFKKVYIYLVLIFSLSHLILMSMGITTTF